MKAFIVSDSSNPKISTAITTMGAIQVYMSLGQAEEFKRMCERKDGDLVVVPVDIFEPSDNFNDQLSLLDKKQ